MVKPHVEEKAKTKQREKFTEKVKELRKKVSGQNLLEGAKSLQEKFKFRPKVKEVDTGSKSGTTKSGYKFYAGGGKAIKGLGRAFSKGGKV